MVHHAVVDAPVHGLEIVQHDCHHAQLLDVLHELAAHVQTCRGEHGQRIRNWLKRVGSGVVVDGDLEPHCARLQPAVVNQAKPKLLGCLREPVSCLRAPSYEFGALDVLSRGDASAEVKARDQRVGDVGLNVLLYHLMYPEKI